MPQKTKCTLSAVYYSRIYPSTMALLQNWTRTADPLKARPENPATQNLICTRAGKGRKPASNSPVHLFYYRQNQMFPLELVGIKIWKEDFLGVIPAHYYWPINLFDLVHRRKCLACFHQNERCSGQTDQSLRFRWKEEAMENVWSHRKLHSNSTKTVIVLFFPPETEDSVLGRDAAISRRFQIIDRSNWNRSMRAAAVLFLLQSRFFCRIFMIGAHEKKTKQKTFACKIFSELSAQMNINLCVRKIGKIKK